MCGLKIDKVMEFTDRNIKKVQIRVNREQKLQTQKKEAVEKPSDEMSYAFLAIGHLFTVEAA